MPASDSDEDEDETLLSVSDLLGGDAAILGEELAAQAAQEGTPVLSSRPAAGATQDTGADDLLLGASLARCVQVSRAAQRGEVLYLAARQPRSVRAAGAEEVALRRVECASSKACLYVCGPAALLSSTPELQRLGIVPSAERAASMHNLNLAATPELARRVSRFAEAVLAPLGRVFGLAGAALAVAVGPSVGHGRNVRGLLLLGVDRFRGSEGSGSDRGDLCRWFCEACRLLAENGEGGGFTAAELTAAMAARYMPQFLEDADASSRRRRRPLTPGVSAAAT